MKLIANWNYPTTVRFGAGRVAELPDEVKRAGFRPYAVGTQLAEPRHDLGPRGGAQQEV